MPGFITIIFFIILLHWGGTVQARPSLSLLLLVGWLGCTPRLVPTRRLPRAGFLHAQKQGKHNLYGRGGFMACAAMRADGGYN